MIFVQFGLVQKFPYADHYRRYISALNPVVMIDVDLSNNSD